MEIINNRRSIRKFTDKKVEEEKIEKILRSAMQAPSAGNQQPWEFLIVTDREDRFSLSKMSPYAAAVKSAPTVLILLADTDRLRYPDNRDQDMSACAQNILLEAVELGLGAVWLGVSPLEDRMDYICKLFSLPPNLIPFCVIPLGYPAEGQENKFTDRFDPGRIHYGKIT